MTTLCLEWPVKLAFHAQHAARHHVAHYAQSSSIFDQDDLLQAYDRILPLADHYRSIMEIHLRELAGCKHIIDLGCGTGIPTIEFLKRGQRVTAVDISQKSLDVLRRKAEAAGCADSLMIMHADIMDLSGIPDQSFDGASSMIVAHLLKHPEIHMRECARLLTDNGVLVLTARVADSSPEALVESTLRSVREREDYEALISAFNVVANRLLRTAHNRSACLVHNEDYLTMLRDAGFSRTLQHDNRSMGNMVTLEAHRVIQ
jgi:ubiquinone/menaquinone biosynthesis C-methylase UbiE